jgi:hypothetical protein
VAGWRGKVWAQDRYRKPDELKIGGGQGWVAADERDRLGHVGGEHPPAGERESGQLDPGLGREQRDRLWAMHDDTAGQVVLQVRADTHQLMAGLDARGA